MESSAFALASLDHFYPPVHALGVGSLRHTRTVALRDGCLTLPYPNVVVEVVDPESGADRLEQLKISTNHKPRVYLCRGEKCVDTVVELSELPKALEELLKQTKE